MALINENLKMKRLSRFMMAFPAFVSFVVMLSSCVENQNVDVLVIGG